jgi:hypothetical protein
MSDALSGLRIRHKARLLLCEAPLKPGPGGYNPGHEWLRPTYDVPVLRRRTSLEEYQR